MKSDGLGIAKLNILLPCTYQLNTKFAFQGKTGVFLEYVFKATKNMLASVCLASAVGGIVASRIWN